MGLTGKQKKYIKKNIRKKLLSEIANQLQVTPQEIESYLLKLWGQKKYQRLVKPENKPLSKTSLKSKISSFNFKEWLKKNRWPLIILFFLILLTYANSLNNAFLSDDISSILENDQIDKISYVFSQPISFLRQLFYFFIVSLFGKNPMAFRSLNIIFHLGTTWLVYLLLSLLTNQNTALLGSILLAVHPIQTEAIVWISGGAHVQYSFFLLLSLLFFLFTYKHKKFLWLSILAFILALLSSEKAAVLPPILLALGLALKTIRQEWKKLLPFFIIGFGWGLVFVMTFLGKRISNLQAINYEAPKMYNPLHQVPVAFISYLKLIFWPQGLTLYHSELAFPKYQFYLIFLIFIAFLGLIVYAFKKNRQIFFWLSFFIISLLPTLTPFGISWIVAERYVYLGAIGVFATVAILIDKVNQRPKTKGLPLTLFLALVIPALMIRTIVRNKDWKNQDNLWLAAAKTSPSSHQNRNNLGDYYSRHGNFERAVEEFKKAIEIKSNYTDAYHNLANTYWQMGKADLAIENYQKALEFNPNLWQSYQNLGGIYFKQEKFELAKEQIEKAVAINPENSIINSNLGIVYLKLGDKTKAKKAFLKALEVDPQNQKAREILSTL